MKRAIEAQRIFRKNKHGMEFVALESIKELQRIDKENEYYILVAPGDDICLEETANFHIVKFGPPFYPVWEQISLPRMLRKIKPDILHCTSNTAPLFCEIPLVLTLHDIIFLEPRSGKSKSLYQNMGWYYRKLFVPRIIKKCRKIITVSAFESERIKRFLNLSEEKITYIYNGYNSHFKKLKSPDRKIISKYIRTEEYIFFLGNTDPKKNLERTLHAYAIYHKESESKLPLLIADLDENILDSVLRKNSLAELRNDITCVRYIENKDLTHIYNGASIFLYTSLRESFGIPMLESMACGTPVIAGNTSSMPEILGVKGIFADPYNPDEIASKMLLLEKNKKIYSDQIEYGLERCEEFSWEETAKGLREIYVSFK